MANSYVNDLKARVYQLDVMLLEALRKGDCDAIRLIEESLEDIMYELDVIECMRNKEVYHVE